MYRLSATDTKGQCFRKCIASTKISNEDSSSCLVQTNKNHMLFIVSKQCACSRHVHIEGYMNRFEYCHPDNNSDNDSFGSFLSKKSYLLQHNSVLIFIL